MTPKTKFNRTKCGKYQVKYKNLEIQKFIIVLSFSSIFPLLLNCNGYIFFLLFIFVRVFISPISMGYSDFPW